MGFAMDGATNTKRGLKYVCLVFVCVLTVLLWLWWLTNDDRMARSRAAQSLSALEMHITRNNFERYNLMSYDEVSQLRLGKAIKVYYLSNDELNHATRDEDLRGLVKDSQERMFPLLVGREGRLTLRVSKSNDGWSVDSVGERDVARKLTRLEQQSEHINSEVRLSEAIDVPAMRLCFAAIEDTTSSRLRLIPLNDRRIVEANHGLSTSGLLARHPDTDDIRNGQMDAREVLGALAIEAREMEEGGNSEGRPSSAPQVLDHGGPGAKESVLPAMKVETPHLVRRGECLSTIAQVYYGRQLWRRVYEANTSIVKNPNLIRPGWKLIIPPFR